MLAPQNHDLRFELARDRVIFKLCLSIVGMYAYVCVQPFFGCMCVRVMSRILVFTYKSASVLTIHSLPVLVCFPKQHL